MKEVAFVTPKELAQAFDLAHEGNADNSVTPGMLFVEYLTQAGMINREKVDRRFVTAVWDAAKHAHGEIILPVPGKNT